MTTEKNHIAVPLTLGLFIAGFCAYWIGTAPNNILPLEISAFIEHFKMSEPMAGALATVESIFVVLATFFLANRVQKLPSVKLAMLGSLIALIAQIVTVYVDNAGVVLWVARIASGIGFGMILAVANVVISQSDDPDKFYSVLWAVAAIFDAALFMIAPLFNEKFGHPGLFIFASLLILLCAAFMIKLPQIQDVSVEEDHVADDNKVAGMTLVAAVFILFSALGGLWSFGEQIMANTFDMDAKESGIIFAISVLAGFVGSMSAALLADKVSRKLLSYSSLVIAITLSVLATQTADKMVFNAAFITFVGLVYFMIPLFLGLAASLAASGEYAAKVSGMVVLGTSVGPIAGGILVDQFGYSSLGGFFFVSGVITFFALMVVFAKQKQAPVAEEPA